jgi:hypothetical protein
MLRGSSSHVSWTTRSAIKAISPDPMTEVKMKIHFEDRTKSEDDSADQCWIIILHTMPW